MTDDDLDQPTVARRLSPRARTALADTHADQSEEPTVAILGKAQNQAAPTSAATSNAGGLHNAANIVRQLDPDPDRELVRAAAPLLLLVAQLRNSIDQADVRSLRQEVVEEIDRFETASQKAGVDAGNIIAARYILCSTIDETVLMTPWGSRSEWSSNSLLNQYHNETWGGEKVFSILERVSADAARKLPLLILIHACLMLGFEGRYRVLEGGRDQLEDLRNELSRTIRRRSKTSADTALSKVTEGFQRGRRLRSLPPLWLLALVAVAILIIVRGFTDFQLEGEIVPALSEIEAQQNQ